MSKFKQIPEWVGTAIFTTLCSLVSFAVMWGSLKSQVSAQVTAQRTDNSDIKQLIKDVGGLKSAVNSLSKNQDLILRTLLNGKR